jgi:hypothetical protein
MGESLAGHDAIDFGAKYGGAAAAMRKMRGH